MEDLNDKLTGGDLLASEWNQVPSEIQNVIEDLGITLSSGDLNQLGKGIAGYVANGTFYTDSGAADAYVLTQIGLKQSATVYTDGFQASFRVGATNTGASTVNVATLGVKSIFYNGSAVTGGELTVGLIVNLRFDSANDRFDLIPNLSNFIDTSGRFIITSPTDEKLRLVSTSVSGNNLITFYQTTTKRAYIEYNDTLNDLRFASEYGIISFWSDSAGTEVLAGYVANNQGLVWGAPSGGSFGAGTLNVENQIAVGTGLASTTSIFHVHAGSSGTTPSGSAANFVLENNATGGASFLGPDAGLQNLFFGTPSDKSGARLIWNYGAGGANKVFTIETNTAGGRLQFNSGNSVLAMSVESDQGVVLGSPAGASKGVGTGNFENGVYENGSKIISGSTKATGSYTTASLAAGATDNRLITHGLGTDDLFVVLNVKGSGTAGSIDGEWSAVVYLVDGSNWRFHGSQHFTASFGAVTLPATGDIRIVTFNEDTVSRTITVKWTVISRL